MTSSAGFANPAEAARRLLVVDWQIHDKNRDTKSYLPKSNYLIFSKTV